MVRVKNGGIVRVKLRLISGAIVYASIVYKQFSIIFLAFVSKPLYCKVKRAGYVP